MSNKDSVSFGALLRQFRKEAKIGLRELANIVNITPSYLSEIETGRKNPPPEDKIIEISQVIGCNRSELLAAAKKGDPAVTDYFASHPPAANFFRMAQDDGFNNDDWERLNELVRIARLGKERGRK